MINPISENGCLNSFGSGRAVETPAQPLSERFRKSEAHDVGCANAVKVIDRSQRRVLQSKKTVDRRVGTMHRDLSGCIDPRSRTLAQLRDLKVRRHGKAAIGILLFL